MQLKKKIIGKSAKDLNVNFTKKNMHICTFKQIKSIIKEMRIQITAIKSIKKPTKRMLNSLLDPVLQNYDYCEQLLW